MKVARVREIEGGAPSNPNSTLSGEYIITRDILTVDEQIMSDLDNDGQGNSCDYCGCAIWPGTVRHTLTSNDTTVPSWFCCGPQCANASLAYFGTVKPQQHNAR